MGNHIGRATVRQLRVNAQPEFSLNGPWELAVCHVIWDTRATCDAPAAHAAAWTGPPPGTAVGRTSRPTSAC
jgi:hypothetical protein